MLPHHFAVDAMNRSNRANMQWYQRNLMKVLQRQKEKHTRDADTTLAIGKQLIDFLNEKVAPPVEVPRREVGTQDVGDTVMKPVEPEVLDIFYNSTEKGAVERYLKERNKKSPEEKFYFRILTSWDYGWQQKESRIPPRDVNHGKCAVLKNTFYRKNNVGPDPPHYSEPAGAQVSICSEYSCTP